ncbi:MULTISPECIES: hypothetical protein [unclassified Novosphingobium]|uniref:hypothetical protein n=1 Tax=unclassified Novosphingobium TaxID=2644732 RepID=UPI0008693B59|nr:MULTISPECIES: hypothetical protein [unclassified Novosphingobium]MBN9143727.1 hypothetical protein [Novosphingobium sp.]ODU84339.1 MAG: hypothetical protein ABT10_02855 [Novosphingobium sp. SCN 63-17]OJX92879.1 MAG: hypothetical protein BGP00_23455 [Novosphingobium sp. 63-713]
MTNAPDFRNGAISLQWRAAIEQLGCPAHMAPDEWAKVIELAHDAAIAALATFFKVASSSCNVEISTNAITNGAELAQMMLVNLQQSVFRYCETCGGGARTIPFNLSADDAQKSTVQ